MEIGKSLPRVEGTLDDFYGKRWDADGPPRSPEEIRRLLVGMVMHPLDVAMQDPKYQPQPRQ